MMEDRFSALLFRTCLVGCLLGAVATLYFIFGLAGYVHSPLLNLSVAVIFAAAFLFFLIHFLFAPRQTNWVGRGVWICTAVILITEGILGLVPPTARDELTHHLAIPRLYAQAGRVVEVPIAPYSYYPMLLDMLYTPWVYWGYDFVPKLIHGLCAFLTGLSLYAYLSRRMNAVYGLLGFFFFVSIPAVLRLSHLAYVDLGVTFYATASLLCILRWGEGKESRKWLVLAGLSAGFAVATKPNGLVAWLLLFFIFALTLVESLERAPAKIIYDLVLYSVMGSLPFLPWLAKNWLQTGNPLFPLLAGFFPASSSTGSADPSSYVSLGIFAKRELLYGESWWQIVALPLRVFFSGQDDNPQYFDGALSPVLILLLPWAFKGKWLKEKRLFASFALLFLAYAILLVDLRVRYILLIVPPLVVLLVYGIFNVYLRIQQPAFLYAGLLFFAGMHATYLWHYVRETAPMTFLSGQESREAYLRRSLADYSAFHYINRELPQTTKIYLLFVGRRAYYCERDYFHDGGELPGLLLGAIRAAKEPADIDRQLKEKRLTHLLVREDLLVKFLEENLTQTQQAIWGGFVSRHLMTLFQESGYSVLQLHG